jgi:hypothetical protein
MNFPQCGCYVFMVFFSAPIARTRGSRFLIDASRGTSGSTCSDRRATVQLSRELSDDECRILRLSATGLSSREVAHVRHVWAEKKRLPSRWSHYGRSRTAPSARPGGMAGGGGGPARRGAGRCVPSPSIARLRSCAGSVATTASRGGTGGCGSRPASWLVARR